MNYGRDCLRIYRPPAKKFSLGLQRKCSRLCDVERSLGGANFRAGRTGRNGLPIGHAQGTDLWCAQIVLDLKKKNPALKLHAILPCEGQERKWTVSAQEYYHSILTQANEVVHVGEEYSRNCMLERNRWLVEHSSILLAVYNGMFCSGTGATIRYARQLGRNIYILNPVTRKMIYS